MSPIPNSASELWTLDCKKAPSIILQYKKYTIDLEKQCWNAMLGYISFVFYPSFLTYLYLFRIGYSVLTLMSVKNLQISVHNLLPEESQAWLLRHAITLPYFISLYCGYYFLILLLHTYFFLCSLSHSMNICFRRTEASTVWFIFLQHQKWCLGHGKPSVNIDAEWINK